MDFIPTFIRLLYLGFLQVLGLGDVNGKGNRQSVDGFQRSSRVPNPFEVGRLRGEEWKRGSLELKWWKNKFSQVSDLPLFDSTRKWVGGVSTTGVKGRMGLVPAHLTRRRGRVVFFLSPSPPPPPLPNTDLHPAHSAQIVIFMIFGMFLLLVVRILGFFSTDATCHLDSKG